MQQLDHLMFAPISSSECLGIEHSPRFGKVVSNFGGTTITFFSSLQSGWKTLRIFPWMQTVLLYRQPGENNLYVHTKRSRIRRERYPRSCIKRLIRLPVICFKPRRNRVSLSILQLLRCFSRSTCDGLSCVWFDWNSLWLQGFRWTTGSAFGQQKLYADPWNSWFLHNEKTDWCP